MATKRSKQTRRSHRAAGTVPRILKWIAVAAVLGLLVYGVSQTSGVAFGEDAIGVVDFSSLSSTEKRSALRAANQARCSCGCGMTLAQCVATDSTCPIREGNVARIRTMVREADRP